MEYKTLPEIFNNTWQKEYLKSTLYPVSSLSHAVIAVIKTKFLDSSGTKSTCLSTILLASSTLPARVPYMMLPFASFTGMGVPSFLHVPGMKLSLVPVIETLAPLSMSHSTHGCCASHRDTCTIFTTVHEPLHSWMLWRELASNPKTKEDS